MLYSVRISFIKLIIYIVLLFSLSSCASTTPGPSGEQEYKEVPIPEQFISEANPRPDVWAKYPGGKESLDWHIQMNTRIPEQARRDGYAGRVIMSYKVDEEGRAGDLEALMSPHNSITEMYSHIVSNMEQWQPAILNDRPVSQRYYIVASFKVGSLDESADN